MWNWNKVTSPGKVIYFQSGITADTRSSYGIQRQPSTIDPIMF